MNDKWKDGTFITQNFSTNEVSYLALELELVEFLEDAVSEGKETPGQERHMQCFPFSTPL